MNRLGCFDAVKGRFIAASILRTTLHGPTMKSRKGSPGCLACGDPPLRHWGAALRYPAVTSAAIRARGSAAPHPKKRGMVGQEGGGRWRRRRGKRDRQRAEAIENARGR